VDIRKNRYFEKTKLKTAHFLVYEKHF